MPSIEFSPSLIRLSLLVMALVGALTAGAFLAGTASAQQPAICDQYPQLPQCEQPTGGGGGGDLDDDGALDDDGDLDEGQGPAGEEGAGPGGLPGAGGPAAGTGAGADGELPFTGYPLTPLVLLLLVLLLAGLAVRGYIAARERRRLRHEAGPSGTP